MRSRQHPFFPRQKGRRTCKSATQLRERVTREKVWGLQRWKDSANTYRMTAKLPNRDCLDGQHAIWIRISAQIIADLQTIVIPPWFVLNVSSTYTSKMSPDRTDCEGLDHRWMSATWSGLSRIALVSLRQPHICQLTHRISRSLSLRCVWRWTDMGTGQCF